MTAWAVVLDNFVKSSEVCFGYLVSGRDVPVERIEDAVGLYINLVPCKCTILQDSLLQQLLTDVHEDFVRSSPNQSFTLTSSPGGEFQGRSLFNATISFQRDDSSNQEIAPDKTTSLERLWSRDPTEVSYSLTNIGKDQEANILQYDIVLSVADKGDAMLVSLYFYNGRIPETEAKAIAMVFSHVIASIIDEPEHTIQQVLPRYHSC
ncbi:hypothetical protein M431DRAFT_477510 [Trichoderma harzianum CBS 226.95]|uniref:Condensation domain-containing protein n=1 Tax=Trichoderma harzianum CBS 226.95 TaxID=983964 RepID=A0A2T4AVM4_TRIHA|nr:hypothetical protein M431DRAFT_477510 [Trichoderma harzianum CBS 226.95]PTB61124.1 hypothetical protein M431DRAFT_477510 [Trichoderma harzianum CBS 226.95]